MTATVANPPIQNLREPLASGSFAQLAALFHSLPHPGEAPIGVLRGEAVALAGVQLLPPPARETATKLLARLIAPVWRGKRIAQGRGSNLWLPVGSPVPFGHFTVRREENGVLVLDYDTPENPRPLRRIVGELRTLAPGLHLGRMDVVTGRGRRTVLYFTLEH